MKTMAAVLFETGKGFEIRDVDLAAPKAGEVMVRMAAGGVCHSDLHVMTGHLQASLPAILGHEGAGVVADVGPGVTSVRAGDHVIPLWRLSCREGVRALHGGATGPLRSRHAGSLDGPAARRHVPLLARRSGDQALQRRVNVFPVFGHVGALGDEDPG